MSVVSVSTVPAAVASGRSAGRPVLLPAAGLAVLAVLVAGCTPGSTAASSSTTGPAPSSPVTTPEQLCTRVVTHWALDRLRPDGGTGADYQQMGLSDGQNTILLEAVERGRAAARAHGAAAGRAEARRVTAQRCAERHATPRPDSPSPSGWPR